MHAVTLILTLLLTVLVSRIIARLVPLSVPLPLFQIALGAGLALGLGVNAALNPKLFFVVFIAPLLFLDGWRIPKNALINDWRSIITLALGLVVFTVVGTGFLIDAMIPAVPLAAAFALGACLSPTDPVAVSAIAATAPIPSRLMHILEGEALFNDASGLVGLRFAVLAVVTGSFSLTDASLNFLQLAAGGLLIGVGIAWGASAAYHGLNRWVGEEPTSSILIGLLIPFGAYLTAEELHCSGVLAAAAAGIAMHYTDLIGFSSAVTRIRRTAVWDMLQDSFNGIIFVLLGLQLPAIVGQAPQIAQRTGIASVTWLAGYVVAITLGLFVLRFIWTTASLTGARVLAAHRNKPRPKPSLQFLMVATLAGVKGAVTLAAVLTLPQTLPDGAAFPARELLICLAMGVIVLTLLISSLGLPLLARNLRVSTSLPIAEGERGARDAASEAAIRRIEQVCSAQETAGSEINDEAAARVIDFYRKRLDYGESGDDAAAERLRKGVERERSLRLLALHAERRALNRMRLDHQIDDTLHHRLVHEIDLAEASLATRHRHQDYRG